MTEARFSRTAGLLGEEGVARLRRAHVAVFGLGGVGSWAAEALVRAGVGRLTLIDGDVVEASNLNRQLPALHSTVGQDKAAVLAARFADIAPDAEVIPLTLFFDENTLEKVPFSDFDFLVDAIDSVPSKLLLIETATRLGIPIISAMGAGNKLDASAFRVGDIYETSVCPLARVMRRLLRQRGIPSLRVVWSTEPPRPALVGPDGRTVPASAPHVPPACGMVLAGEVILKLSGVEI